jgi:chromate reductase
MAKVIGISGSLRKGSFNSALLRAAVHLAPAALEIEMATIQGIPLYDGDIEAQGLPPAVVTLKERIAAADGLLLVTPEYNHSIPGVLKNAIDWVSRPAKEIPAVFGGRALGLVGVSSGPGGTRHAQVAWLPVIRALTVVPYHGAQMFVANGRPAFDAEANLVDEGVRKQLQDYLAGFATFVVGLRRR